MARRPYLDRLAHELGILPSYVDASGRRTCVASDETRAQLAGCMGFDASTESAARRACQELRKVRDGRLLQPVQCISSPPARPLRIALQLSPGFSHTTSHWHAELIDERGVAATDAGAARMARGKSQITVTTRLQPGLGYHHLNVTLETARGTRSASQQVIVAPVRCRTCHEVLGGQPRGLGLWANLYSIRNPRNWGVGDLTDLARLASWAGGRGADFLAINPLHALRNSTGYVSPYSPVSRLFRNLLYLDIESMPEFKHSEKARRLVQTAGFQDLLRRLRVGANIDYAGVASCKLRVLEILYDEFVNQISSGRQESESFLDFLKAHQGSLEPYTTFMAVVQDRRGLQKDAYRWRSWEQALRDRDRPSIYKFRDAHERDCDVHLFIQFALDRQFARAAEAARHSGLKLGLCNDLALGSAFDGADVWANQEVFARTATVGAPPDPLAPHGQDWNFPPLKPHALRETGYAFWRRLVQSNCRHAGMLRIDHILGLFRQFWIPQGRPASEGAYVRYPADDLLAILALESHRHGTAIIGEDLGTVPPEVPRHLARKGILSLRVLTFERTRAGTFRRPRDIGRNAVLYATTHDTVPLAGLWSGADLEQRRRAGAFTSPTEYEQACAERAKTRHALERRLRAEGLLPVEGTLSMQEIISGVYRLLARSRAPLVAVALDDLAGEENPVNLPGVGPRHHPSWTRRMARNLRSLMADPFARRVLLDMRRVLRK